MQLLSKLLLPWTRLIYILILAKIILHIAVFECSQKYLKLGLGGGQVVSVHAFDSNDPSLNSTKVYNFSVKLLKRTKIYKKEAGDCPFKKQLPQTYRAIKV